MSIIKQLRDVYGDDYYNTKEMVTLLIYEGVIIKRLCEDVFQTMHKANGGTRKLKDVSIELRIQILGALHSIDFEPIGIRGLYYRIVSIYGLPKTEATYKKVQAMALDMRRDGSLGYEYIIDGSRHTYGINTYNDPHEFLTNVSNAYRRDIWSSSRFKVEVTVEKDSMRDILMPVCNEYSVDLSPTSGFNSETAWYNLAERYKAMGENVVPVLLMLTDYDTSGLRMVKSAEEAFTRFGVTVLVKHVGLLPKHITKFNLLTRIDKEDPTLEACELDAMTPHQAREILKEAIIPFVDETAFRVIREQEDRERVTLLGLAKGLN